MESKGKLYSLVKERRAQALQRTLQPKGCGWGCLIGFSSVREEAEFLRSGWHMLREPCGVSSLRMSFHRHLELQCQRQRFGAEVLAQAFLARHSNLKCRVRGLCMKHAPCEQVKLDEAQRKRTKRG